MGGVLRSWPGVRPPHRAAPRPEGATRRAVHGRFGNSPRAAGDERPGVPACGRAEPNLHAKANLIYDQRTEIQMIQLTQQTRSGWCVVSIRGRADAETADQLET